MIYELPDKAEFDKRSRSIVFVDLFSIGACVIYFVFVSKRKPTIGSTRCSAGCLNLFSLKKYIKIDF